MKRIVFLGLVFLALGIFVGSCSQPGFPYGYSYRVGGGADTGTPDNDTPEPPPGFRNAEGTTVIEQLQWLQTYALRTDTSTGSYMVWARVNEPHIPGDNDFGIVYDDGRNNIRVRIGTVPGIVRQTLQLTGSGFILNVGANNTLELENINLQGLPFFYNVYPRKRMVHVEDGTLRMTNAEIRGSGNVGVRLVNSELEMNDGASIHSNNRGVNANNSEVTMNNGSIIKRNASESSGSGIALDNGSNLTINGGRIYRNISMTNGGGVSVGTSSSLTMISGLIHINRSLNGGGVDIGNGGTMVMNGGDIQGNEAQNLGGGVRVGHGTFRKYGGLIQNNTAQNGGGVAVGLVTNHPVNNAKMQMFGNARIYNNTARISFQSSSGGVFIGVRGILNMRSDDAVIQGNRGAGTALLSTIGAGVALQYTFSTLQMYRGRIYGIDAGPGRQNYNVNSENAVGKLTNGEFLLGTFVGDVFTPCTLFPPPGPQNDTIVVSNGVIVPFFP